MAATKQYVDQLSASRQWDQGTLVSATSDKRNVEKDSGNLDAFIQNLQSMMPSAAAADSRHFAPQTVRGVRCYTVKVPHRPNVNLSETYDAVMKRHPDYYLTYKLSMDEDQLFLWHHDSIESMMHRLASRRPGLAMILLALLCVLLCASTMYLYMWLCMDVVDGGGGSESQQHQHTFSPGVLPFVAKYVLALGNAVRQFTSSSSSSSAALESQTHKHADNL